MGTGDGDGVEIGDCSLDVVVASGRWVSGCWGRPMAKRGLPRETASHRMLRVAVSIWVCDQHFVDRGVYLGDESRPTRRPRMGVRLVVRLLSRGLANRIRGRNSQAANHTRERSAETGTHQRYAQDLLKTRPVRAGRVGRLLVGEGTVRRSPDVLETERVDRDIRLSSVCLCHVHYICIYSTSHAAGSSRAVTATRADAGPITYARVGADSTISARLIRPRGCVRAAHSR